MRQAFGGIDFGTSNSTVGVIRDGKARLVALEGEQATLPSAIFFNFEDGHTYFGRRAIGDCGIHGRVNQRHVLQVPLGLEERRDGCRIARPDGVDEHQVAAVEQAVGIVFQRAGRVPSYPSRNHPDHCRMPSDRNRVGLSCRPPGKRLTGPLPSVSFNRPPPAGASMVMGAYRSARNTS